MNDENEPENLQEGFFSLKYQCRANLFFCGLPAGTNVA